MQLNTTGGSEENPQNIKYGQATAAAVINAVLQSPAWRRVLFLYVYDEHGGYYDHVPPPAAIKPDDIPPTLGPNNVPGGYDVYGPRSSRGRHVRLLEAARGDERRARSHVAAGDHRGEVEPSRDDLPRRERRDDARLHRHEAHVVPRPTDARAGAEPTARVVELHRRVAHRPTRHLKSHTSLSVLASTTSHMRSR